MNNVNGERGYRVGTAAGLAAVVAGAAVLMAALPGGAAPAQEPGPTPSSTVVADNPTCGELGDFEAEFKINNPTPGTYSDDDSELVVNITEVTAGNPMTFSFEANIPVAAVFVKAGDGGILYTFEPPSTTGTDLASPKDSISHISFCWNPDQTTTTSTTPDESTTSTTDTGESTTTTAEETTTTTAPGETTSSTAPGEVEATTTSAGPTGQLPRTGSSTTPLLAAGAALVALGAGVVALARRLRHT